MSPQKLLAHWQIYLLAVALLSACSLLVSPEKSAPHCTVGDDNRDPCPDGTVCKKERCVEAACGPYEICLNKIDDDCDHRIDEMNDRAELCNQVDDDCNGKIDEGHDGDGDGKTWCGDLTSNIAGDCDELNKNIYPGADEICDGIDNDCDRITDEPPEGGSLCERADQQCLDGACVTPGCSVDPTVCPRSQSCIDNQCIATGCTETSCGEGRICNTKAGLCESVLKATNGQSCTRSDECQSGTCVDGAALRLSSGGRVCVQACCIDTDCPASQICFASGTGARSCLPGARPSRGTRQCSSSAECGAQACAVGVYPGIANGDTPEVYTSVCRARALGELEPGGSPCYADASCVSKVCVPGPLTSFVGVCSTPCKTTEDCKPLSKYYGGFNPYDPDPVAYSYCRFVDTAEIVEDIPSNDEYVAICVIGRSETGSGNFGDRCSSGSACKDGACVGATSQTQGRCAPTCCNDQQCTAMGRGAARCLPIARGGHYEMRCVQ